MNFGFQQTNDWSVLHRKSASSTNISSSSQSLKKIATPPSPHKKITDPQSPSQHLHLRPRTAESPPTARIFDRVQNRFRCRCFFADNKTLVFCHHRSKLRPLLRQVFASQSHHHNASISDLESQIPHVIWVSLVRVFMIGLRKFQIEVWSGPESITDLGLLSILESSPAFTFFPQWIQIWPSRLISYMVAYPPKFCGDPLLPSSTDVEWFIFAFYHKSHCRFTDKLSLLVLLWSAAPDNNYLNKAIDLITVDHTNQFELSQYCHHRSIIVNKCRWPLFSICNMLIGYDDAVYLPFYPICHSLHVLDSQTGFVHAHFLYIDSIISIVITGCQISINQSISVVGKLLSLRSKSVIASPHNHCKAVFDYIRYNVLKIVSQIGFLRCTVKPHHHGTNLDKFYYKYKSNQTYRGRWITDLMWIAL